MVIRETGVRRFLLTVAKAALSVVLAPFVVSAFIAAGLAGAVLHLIGLPFTIAGDALNERRWRRKLNETTRNMTSDQK